MAKIYVPTAYVNNCNVFYSNFIRSYTSNDRSSWVDIYFKSDYGLIAGSGNSQLVVCDTLNTYTDEVYYRYDFPMILLMFILLLLFCFWFPYKILSRLFGRWLKW